MVLKILKGKASRCLSLKNDQPGACFDVRIHFDDVEAINFHHGDSEDPPHVAILMVSMPEIKEDEGCSHCDSLRGTLHTHSDLDTLMLTY